MDLRQIPAYNFTLFFLPIQNKGGHCRSLKHSILLSAMGGQSFLWNTVMGRFGVSLTAGRERHAMHPIVESKATERGKGKTILAEFESAISSEAYVNSRKLAR